jgi:hypothetical protein
MKRGRLLQLIYPRFRSATSLQKITIDTIRDIEKSIQDVRAGRTLSMNEVRRRLKMK